MRTAFFNYLLGDPDVRRSDAEEVNDSYLGPLRAEGWSIDHRPESDLEGHARSYDALIVHASGDTRSLARVIADTRLPILIVTGAVQKSMMLAKNLPDRNGVEYGYKFTTEDARDFLHRNL